MFTRTLQTQRPAVASIYKTELNQCHITYPNIIQKKGATGQLNMFPATAASVNSPTIG